MSSEDWKSCVRSRGLNHALRSRTVQPSWSHPDLKCSAPPSSHIPATGLRDGCQGHPKMLVFPMLMSLPWDSKPNVIPHGFRTHGVIGFSPNSKQNQSMSRVQNPIQPCCWEPLVGNNDQIDTGIHGKAATAGYVQEEPYSKKCGAKSQPIF